MLDVRQALYLCQPSRFPVPYGRIVAAQKATSSPPHCAADLSVGAFKSHSDCIVHGVKRSRLLTAYPSIACSVSWLALKTAFILQVSNKALLAMLSHKTQDAQQVEEELQDIMHALAANGEQQGTQYVSVLQVSAAAKAKSSLLHAVKCVENMVAGLAESHGA